MLHWKHWTFLSVSHTFTYLISELEILILLILKWSQTLELTVYVLNWLKNSDQEQKPRNTQVQLNFFGTFPDLINNVCVFICLALRTTRRAPGTASNLTDLTVHHWTVCVRVFKVIVTHKNHHLCFILYKMDFAALLSIPGFASLKRAKKRTIKVWNDRNSF